MKKLILILVAAAASGWHPSPAGAQVLKNTLRPFSTDGCSNFPDGVPYFSSNLWLRCCVVHDVAYWQGGTKAMRQAADETLFECVRKTSGSHVLADLIWTGVHVGGAPGLPTSTGWGKGWTIQRGYAPFTEEEQKQIDALYPTLPANDSDIELEKRSTIRPRYFLSDNHCLDVATIRMQTVLQAGVEVESKTENYIESAEGTKLRLEVVAKGCDEPFVFQFLLLRKTACTDEMNELTARGRIRLESWSGPKSCGK